jgi:2-polyprenyl-3-methyl-5-hydroxy-6-metoxy-1,4-benzoquinol methylase
MDTVYSDLSENYAVKPEDYYDCARTEMIPFISKSSRKVLDIGCSSGKFGALLKEERPNMEVWGFEPDPEAASIAATYLDKVINGVFSVDHPDILGQSFDTICFNDVLEHLVDPFTVLKQATTLMTENGQIVASIPNILFYGQILQILIRQDWKYQESGILDYTHLRFFTKKSILRMFHEAGLQVTQIRGISADSSLRWRLFNLFTLGRFRDWKYIQFAVSATIASKRKHRNDEI